MTDVAFEVIDGQEASYYRKEKESDTISGHVTKIPYVIDEDANTSLSTIAGGIKTEDAAHASGDTGVMVLGVRKDTVANLAGTDGDYAPMPVGANGMYVDAHLGEVLSYLLDSIDVAKMSKGAITTVHNAITATATSAEVDCRGFNSLLVHWVSSATDKTWVISVTGAMGSGLTFVPLLDKTTGLAASEITTDISGFFVISNIPDYLKIVCTEVDDGATVTCKVQPFNS